MRAMNADGFPYRTQDAMLDESSADEYERARKSRARLAYRRGLIDSREFERELYESEREACEMRGAIIAKLLSR